MKSSNPIVMMEAYRLLVSRMESENMSYPLHLGVTEAGGEEEGRIKSALGISSLLADGLGDTIRVSLTEDPEFEIPVAKKIVAKYNQGFEVNNPIQLSWNNLPYHPFEYQRRHSKEVINIGGSNVPRVIADLSFLSANDISKETLSAIDHHYQPVTDKWHSGDLAVDYLYLGDTLSPFMLPNGTKAIYRYNTWLEANNPLHTYPLLSLEEFLSEDIDIPTAKFVEISALNINDDVFEAIKKDNSVIVFLTNEGAGEATFHQMRMWCILATQKGITAPIVFASDYSTTLDSEEFIIQSASDIGGLLADGFGDGLLFTYQPNTEILPLINRTSFNILQASRTRISKTEYISCPSCGRTLFDLQETTAMIRKETDHLKGVKIAIMGCIVNGPGEMADADFGYVGVGNQKITLYRGKEVVKKNIDSQFALQELINLIKENGYWIERN
jgi:(E)-4-hydroxy-3-methylbut-2-enyl-diphosphate synthase